MDVPKSIHADSDGSARKFGAESRPRAVGCRRTWDVGTMVIIIQANADFGCSDGRDLSVVIVDCVGDWLSLSLGPEVLAEYFCRITGVGCICVVS